MSGFTAESLTMSMNIWWAPGQSLAAKEICRQLNRREKAGLIVLSFFFGLCAFAVPLVLMGSAMKIGPLHEHLGGFTFPILICFAVTAWLIIILQRQLLLKTQTAKDKDYTLADLRATRPLSRRDYLTFGGIAVFAVVVGLAGVWVGI